MRVVILIAVCLAALFGPGRAMAELRYPTVPWSEVQAGLQSDNEEVRFIAAWTLAVDKPEAQDPALVIPLLELALTSDDAKVQAAGAHAAGRVAYATWPRLRRQKGEPTPFDFSSNERIGTALVALLGHEDPEAQASAISALALVYEPMVELEPQLLQRWRQSDHSGPKGRLLLLMAEWNMKSKAVVQAMIDGLASESPHLQERAAQALGVAHPPEALAPLLGAYFTADDAVKDDILRALGSYRSAGLATAELRAAREDLENLQRALSEADGPEEGGQVPEATAH